MDLANIKYVLTTVCIPYKSYIVEGNCDKCEWICTYLCSAT